MAEVKGVLLDKCPSCHAASPTQLGDIGCSWFECYCCGSYSPQAQDAEKAYALWVTNPQSSMCNIRYGWKGNNRKQTGSSYSRIFKASVLSFILSVLSMVLGACLCSFGVASEKAFLPMLLFVAAFMLLALGEILREIFYG